MHVHVYGLHDVHKHSKNFYMVENSCITPTIAQNLVEYENNCSMKKIKKKTRGLWIPTCTLVV